MLEHLTSNCPSISEVTVAVGTLSALAVELLVALGSALCLCSLSLLQFDQFYALSFFVFFFQQLVYPHIHYHFEFHHFCYWFH